MKKWAIRLMKGIGILLLLVAVLIGGYAAYISMTWNKDYSAVEKPALTASTDPAIIARGEYLVHSVAHCSVCHVPYEVTEKRAPGEHPIMSGGLEWDMGPMGTLRSPNITPDPKTGIGSWTDAELARAIKWGVGRDGKLLVFMNLSVPAMADEDIQAVLSYLRSTAPVEKEDRPHDVGLMLKWLATLAGPDFRKALLDGLKYTPAADSPSLERGQYLANGPGFCVACHSPFDMMSMSINGPRFSGSDQVEPDREDSTMVYRMPNLTPDPKTGHIASWTEEQFVTRFRAGRALKTSKMPWEAFREMNETDLRSLYRYLMSLPPTSHYIGATHRKADEDPAKDPANPNRT